MRSSCGDTFLAIAYNILESVPKFIYNIIMVLKVKYNEGEFIGSGGIKLFFRSWAPDKPKGTIAIVHGIGEHSARYEYTGMRLAGLGYSVYAYDQRGNGRSEGARGHINNFSEYLLDLECLINNIHGKTDNIFILGHSLGGLVTLRFAIDYPDLIKAIIVSSPALGLSMKVPVLQLILAHGLNKLFPTFTLTDNSIETKYLSHDENVCHAYDSDPAVHKKRSVRFFNEYLKISKKTSGEPQELKCPSLFLAGEDDRIVSTEKIKAFYGGITASKKGLHVYPGFYHEILNEVGKEKAFKDIETWLGSLTR